jgi:hypothetical protein
VQQIEIAETQGIGVKAKMIAQKGKIPLDIRFHYTPQTLVKYCLSFVPFDEADLVLDAGAGKNMVWYRNIPVKNKDWCELELQKDFFKYSQKVDWIVGNPPYKLCWKFWEKSFDLSNKGVAFLISINMLNKFTPNRLELAKSKGFYINKIVIVNCKKWFGRYFFVIFQKTPRSFVDWNLASYGDTKSDKSDSPCQLKITSFKQPNNMSFILSEK